MGWKPSRVRFLGWGFYRLVAVALLWGLVASGCTADGSAGEGVPDLPGADGVVRRDELLPRNVFELRHELPGRRLWRRAETGSVDDDTGHCPVGRRRGRMCDRGTKDEEA